MPTIAFEIAAESLPRSRAPSPESSTPSSPFPAPRRERPEEGEAEEAIRRTAVPGHGTRSLQRLVCNSWKSGVRSSPASPRPAAAAVSTGEDAGVVRVLGGPRRPSVRRSKVDRGGAAVLVRVEVENAGSAGELIQRLLEEVSTGGKGVQHERDNNRGRSRGPRRAKPVPLSCEVNERVLEVTGVVGVPIWPVSFICECGHDSCFEQVSLSREEYESVRSNPRTFFVAPSEEHFIPEAEWVLQKTERFWVVEKMGEDAAVAEKFDSRSAAPHRDH